MSTRGTDEGRRRGHQTRVARSRAALVQALVELVEEDVRRGRTGVQISPASVARQASVSTSTLYNRFPGGVPEVASEAVSRARQSRTGPIAALVALAATHQETSRVRESADGRLRSALARLPLDPSDADLNDIRRLADGCAHGRETASPEILARCLLYLASSYFYFPKSERFAFAKEACLLLEGLRGFDPEFRDALRNMVRAADAKWLSSGDWVLVANGADKLSQLWRDLEPSESWQWKLYAVLLQRAPNGDSLSQVDRLLSKFAREASVIPGAHLSNDFIRHFADVYSMAGQSGLLSKETLVAASSVAFEMDSRLGSKSLMTLTEVYRLQLVRNTFALELPFEEVFDPFEPHIPNAQALLWAPLTAPMRRRWGLTSTAIGEKAFLERLAVTLYVTQGEMKRVSEELDFDDLDAKIEAAKELDHLSDPAAPLVLELGRVVRDLMTLQPQSAELRRRARSFSRLLADELLEPPPTINESLVPLSVSG